MFFVAPHNVTIVRSGRGATVSRFLSSTRVCYWVPTPCRTIIQATIPPGSNSERNDDQKTRNQEGNCSPAKPDSKSEQAPPKSEMDIFAEQWIGTDISRWEWYERYKNRQEKIDKINVENKRRLDEEMTLLKNTLMELEDAFGARLLDEKSNVSPLGWGIIALIMSSYIAFSYVVIHALVSGVLQMSSSYTFS